MSEYKPGTKIKLKDSLLHSEIVFVIRTFNILNNKCQVYQEGSDGVIEYQFDLDDFYIHEGIDNVNHPPHYTSSPIKCSHCKSTIECIDVTRHFNFALGNTIKYLWRADHKGRLLEDLKKARWYLDDHIKQLENME